MKFLKDMFDKKRPDFEKGGKLEKLYPLFEAKETFLFVLPHRTKDGSHVRDNLDTKRLMSIVALLHLWYLQRRCPALPSAWYFGRHAHLQRLLFRCTEGATDSYRQLRCRWYLGSAVCCHP